MAATPPNPPRDQRAADPHAGASNAPALEMRLSVPSQGELCAVAGELAAKVAEFLGGEAGTIGETLDSLTSRVAASGEEITFEFSHRERALIILARCDGRSSEVRHPLPA
jgi:hypothetical protein